jgi:hypothetical protein
MISHFGVGTVGLWSTWSKQSSAPDHQLADIIGTFIKLIPVGCPIPKHFSGHFKTKGNTIAVPRDAIVVPNGPHFRP